MSTTVATLATISRSTSMTFAKVRRSRKPWRGRTLPLRKKAFYNANAGQLDSTIDAAFSVYVEEHLVEFKRDTMKKAGGFKDEDDIKDKYMNKPQQLAAILRNAPRMWGPVREVELTEDPEFSSGKVSGSEFNKGQKRTLTQEQERMVRGTPDKSRKGSEIKLEPKIAKTLTGAQVGKLKRIQARAKDIIKKNVRPTLNSQQRRR